MTHNIVRLPDQLVAFETADLHEGRIGIHNAALDVRARDQILVLAQTGFVVENG
ncbi:hypothetical protein J3Q30_00940 [Bordetella holmesii]|nr:hypothetical protein [Bordetella holmesii]MBO1239143.1 hypothetical protein [Bordetella holmesii]MBO1244676.1 hypothetical protein [Bordetella holmesii]MBO1247811.1 hypothetical protein [Bordetella holmesii]MBO1251128.1 hypothetical protein [Bordetella holmesii]MBO1257376.1 hypothetical protein [Bordetella holmesii]